MRRTPICVAPIKESLAACQNACLSKTDAVSGVRTTKHTDGAVWLCMYGAEEVANQGLLQAQSLAGERLCRAGNEIDHFHS
jgi:hypothetical protein